MDKKSVKSFVVIFPEIRNDATIGLAAGTAHDSAKWEIVLGANGGTETIIRPCNKCNLISRKKHSKAQFNQVSIFRRLTRLNVFIKWASKGVKVAFDDGFIKLTCESSGDEIISYRSTSVKKRNIKHLLVSSSNGASGIWTITELNYSKSRSRREVLPGTPRSTVIHSED